MDKKQRFSFSLLFICYFSESPVVIAITVFVKMIVRSCYICKNSVYNMYRTDYSTCKCRYNSEIFLPGQCVITCFHSFVFIILQAIVEVKKTLIFGFYLNNWKFIMFHVKHYISHQGKISLYRKIVLMTKGLFKINNKF